MLWEKIVNPDTGTTVSIRSKTGRMVLKNYVDLMGGGKGKKKKKGRPRVPPTGERPTGEPQRPTGEPPRGRCKRPNGCPGEPPRVPLHVEPPRGSPPKSTCNERSWNAVGKAGEPLLADGTVDFNRWLKCTKIKNKKLKAIKLKELCENKDGEMYKYCNNRGYNNSRMRDWRNSKNPKGQKCKCSNNTKTKTTSSKSSSKQSNKIDATACDNLSMFEEVQTNTPEDYYVQEKKANKWLAEPHGQVGVKDILNGLNSIRAGVIGNFLTQSIRMAEPLLKFDDEVFINRQLLQKVRYNSTANCSGNHTTYEECSSHYSSGIIQKWWRGTVVHPVGKQTYWDENDVKQTRMNGDIPTTCWESSIGNSIWHVTIKFDENPKIGNSEVPDKIVTFIINTKTGALTRRDRLNSRLINFFRNCRDSTSEEYNIWNNNVKYTLAVSDLVYDRNWSIYIGNYWALGSSTLKAVKDKFLDLFALIKEYGPGILKRGKDLALLILKNGQDALKVLNNARKATLTETKDIAQWVAFKKHWGKVASSDTTTRCIGFGQCCEPFFKKFLMEIGQISRGVHNLHSGNCRVKFPSYGELFKENSICDLKKTKKFQKDLQDSNSPQYNKRIADLLDKKPNIYTAEDWKKQCDNYYLNQWSDKIIRLRCEKVMRSGVAFMSGIGFRKKTASNWIEYATNPEGVVILKTIYAQVLLMKTCLYYFGEEVNATFETDINLTPTNPKLQTLLGYGSNFQWHDWECSKKTLVEILNYYDLLLREIIIYRNPDQMSNLVLQYIEFTGTNDSSILETEFGQILDNANAIHSPGDSSSKTTLAWLSGASSGTEFSLTEKVVGWFDAKLFRDLDLDPQDYQPEGKKYLQDHIERYAAFIKSGLVVTGRTIDDIKISDITYGNTLCTYYTGEKGGMIGCDEDASIQMTRASLKAVKLDE